MTEETTAELINKLREATREAHEALKESRAERKKLEALKEHIKDLVTSATINAIELKITEAAKTVNTVQEALEESVQQRFNEIVVGPIADLEKLLRKLYKVHATNPMEILAKNPPSENPLFSKMEKVDWKGNPV